MIATSACIVLSGSALAFDFQATTPCAAEVVEAMAPFWSADWAIPPAASIGAASAPLPR